MASPDLEKLLRVHDDQDNVNTSAHKVTKRSRKLVFACLVLLTVLALTVPFYGLTCRTLRDNARAAAIRPGFRHATPHGSFRGGSSQPAVLIDAARDDGVRQKSIDDSAVLDGRDASDAATADAAAPTVLECFQVAQPVLMPDGPATSDGLRTEDGDGGRRGGAESCTVQLMDHVFAWSYGKPFVGEYVPPSCDFNRVVINFTVVSEGVQYDRLALMYFGDTEVWRTSTAEPTAHPGIRWVYLKDMTEYLYFWKSPQKLIFDLGNLVDDRYTGTFNTTLTATFFTSDVDPGNAPPSDLIIPVSAHKSGTNEPSAFTVPESDATDTVQFPQNANRAVFSVSACGQAAEEFWWQNLLQSDIWAFNATTGEAFPGYSPFREVQVYIDGQLAGVQWPFPVIFTGGVVPSFHRPIVGLDAFDLREHEIDITPWLPLLCDGAPHTFTMRVAGVDDDNGKNPTLTKTVLSNWVLSGKIFVWLDDEGSVTTGSKPAIMGELPAIQLSHALGKNATGSNETLRYITNVKRTFGVSAQVASQKSSGIASWSQDLSYSNRGRVTGFGFNQVNDVSIEGKDRTSGLYSYGSSYSYPLSCGQTYSVSDEGNLTIQATLYQGLRLQVSGSSVFPTGLEAFAAEGEFAGGSLLETHRYGQAAYNRWGNQKRSTGSGHTNQVFRFGGLASGGTAGGSEGVELYFRNVTAVNDTVVFNEEKVAGAPETVSSAPPSPLPADSNFRGLFAQVPTRGQRASMAVKGSAGVGRGAPADGSTPQLGIEQSPMRR